MRTIIEYLDAAIEKQELGSDRQLSRKLGLSDQAVSTFRTGKTLPAPETMVKLARLASLDEKVALLELSFMGAKDEETRTVYKELMRKVSGVLTVLIIALGVMISTPSKAAALENTSSSNIWKYTLSHLA